MEEQIEQIRRLLVFVVAWLCFGFSAAVLGLIFLAVEGHISWWLAIVPAAAGALNFISVVRHEGARWTR